MPRKVTSRIHDYFLYDDFKSLCQLTNKEGYICNAAIKGKHAGNLEKHVKTWHADEWQNYWSEKTLSVSQTSVLSSDTPEDSMSYKPHFVNVDLSYFESEVLQCQPVPTTPDTRKRKACSTPLNIKIIKQSVKFTDIEEAAIELVTLNGMPLSTIEASGFKKLLSILYQGSNTDSVTLTQNRLQKLIKSRAESIRTIITEITKDKLVSLRIDCAIVENRHVFGVNVHIRKKNRCHVFNLGVLNLSSDYSQDFLKEKIINVLLEYGIQIGQIYYVLVTNCSPGIKKSSNAENTENPMTPASPQNCKSECAEYGDYDSDFDLFEVEETELDSEEEENHNIECDEEVTNDEATEKIIEDVIACWSQENHLIVGRSLTHALQMAVLDTLDEDEEIRVLLKKIRNILKKLRSHIYIQQLKTLRCKKKPILDSKSRLCSTYDMLQRLMDLKPYLDQLSASSKEINISLAEWNTVMDIVDSLKPLKSTTSRSLSRDFTLSEFYKIWISCFLRTKKIDAPFSQNLCKNMNKRKAWLFENIAFKSSLFLDPRFKNTLSANDHEEVFAHLAQLNQRMVDLNSSNPASNQDLKRSIKLEKNCVDEDDDLYDYIQSMVKTPTKSQNNDSPDITAALDNFKESEPLIEIQNVPAFWQEKKHLNSEVYKLSQIVLSVPAINAYVETFTSQVKFLSNYFNSRLYKEILLVRSNFHFFRDYHSSFPENVVILPFKS